MYVFEFIVRFKDKLNSRHLKWKCYRDESCISVSILLIGCIFLYLQCFAGHGSLKATDAFCQAEILICQRINELTSVELSCKDIYIIRGRDTCYPTEVSLLQPNCKDNIIL